MHPFILLLLSNTFGVDADLKIMDFGFSSSSSHNFIYIVHYITLMPLHPQLKPTHTPVPILGT